MLTYNQVFYIESAIKSVLRQKTKFSILLLISDDASTDGTDKVCENYAYNFPNEILFYRNSTNLGSRQNSLINIKRCLDCGAKYIAFLEGDDFWTNRNKLQLQVDLLDSQSFVACTTNYIEQYNNQSLNYHYSRNSSGRLQGIFKNFKDLDQVNLFDKKRCYSIGKSSKWYTKTLTAVVRCKAINLNILKKYEFLNDTIFFREISKTGNIIFLDVVTGIYRLHYRGIYSGLSQVDKESLRQKIYKELREKNLKVSIRILRIQTKLELFFENLVLC